jgi:hypothetical protein
MRRGPWRGLPGAIAACSQRLRPLKRRARPQLDALPSSAQLRRACWGCSCRRLSTRGTFSWTQNSWRSTGVSALAVVSCRSSAHRG